MTGRSGKTKVAGVMGWPVGHSLSPRLHAFWLDRLGVDGVYVPMPVRPERITEAVRALPALGFRGCNVTIPHKEAALEAVDEISPAARRIGAVNTIIVEDGGGLVGGNTDAFGFMENLRLGAPDWDPGSAPAVILGAGGAARAVLAALIDAGVPDVRLANRTDARAAELAAVFGGPITAVPWEGREAILEEAGLLVNATSLGMTGKDPLEIGLSNLPETAVVTDIVYNPLTTPLLNAAKERGNPVVDGLGMLLHQARPGFEAWFQAGRPEVTDELRGHVLAGLGQRG